VNEMEQIQDGQQAFADAIAEFAVVGLGALVLSASAAFGAMSMACEVDINEA